MKPPPHFPKVLRRTGKASPAVVILLGMILVALLAIIILMSLPSERDESGLLEPIREVDTTRIQQTYVPGRRYRSIVQGTLNARASAKDWGIETVTNFHYMGEAVMTRLVEKNDGKTLVFVVAFDDARSLAVSTRIDGLYLRLPGQLQLGLEGLNGLALLAGASPLPLGWTQVSISGANTFLNNPVVLDTLSKAASDRQSQVFRFMDEIEGKTVRVTYVNGEGVTRLEPINTQLSKDEEDFIRNLAFLSDAHIFPDLTSEPGQQWLVRGEDLMGMLDPSMRAVPRGTITVRRGSDEGSPPQARLEIQRGVLELQDVSKTEELKARWAPRGHMMFDFGSQIVTYSELTGQFSVETRSTDHILFEARYTVRPDYEVHYWCEVLH